MDALQAWGIELIVALQTGAPALDGPMEFLSLLGSADFFTLLIPLLYWCVDAGLGARFIFVLLTGDSIVGLAKLAFHAPRPYWIDARVRALAAEPSYGVPSGHAQSTASAWVFLARSLGRGWVWAAALALILLVGLSRLHVGVHFPHDVAAGWLIGAAVVGAFWRLEPRATGWLARQAPAIHYLAACILPAAIVLLWAAIAAPLAGTADPPGWEQQAARALPPPAGEAAIDPRNPESLFTNAGVLFGGGVGLAWAHRRWRFDAGGAWWKRAARFALGIAGLLALQLGLGAVLPDEPLALGYTLRFVRYALIGAWVTGIAPAVFLKFGLADAAATRPR